MGKYGLALLIFVAIFAAVFLAWQTVGNMHLSTAAEIAAQDLFSWSIPGPNWSSQIRIDSVEVVRRTANDAEVKVAGTQTLEAANPGASTGKAALDMSSRKSETVSCGARLTFYRQNNKWILGRVDL